MNQPLSTIGNCGIYDKYPPWITTMGARVSSPNSSLPSVFNSPADPWTIMASGWQAGNPSGAGTGGCFICLRLYAPATAQANAVSSPRKYYPQPYLQAYVHDSESSGVLAVDDPAWYTNTQAQWRAVDCPVGNYKVYYQSQVTQAAGFTKLWVLGATIPVTAVSVSSDNVTWLATKRNTGDSAWIQSQMRWSTSSFPVTCYLKMTSLRGEVLYDSFQWTRIDVANGFNTLQPDQVAIDGNVQFQGYGDDPQAPPGFNNYALSRSPATILIATLIISMCSLFSGN